PLSGCDEPTAKLVRAIGGCVFLEICAEGSLLAMVPERGFGIAARLIDDTSSKVRRAGHTGAVRRPHDERGGLLPKVETAILKVDGSAVGAIDIILGR
ncbi:MAG: hypothetical protein ACJ8H8_00760, partial [Geminicoccaceae bacterium]